MAVCQLFGAEPDSGGVGDYGAVSYRGNEPAVRQNADFLLFGRRGDAGDVLDRGAVRLPVHQPGAQPAAAGSEGGPQRHGHRRRRGRAGDPAGAQQYGPDCL